MRRVVLAAVISAATTAASLISGGAASANHNNCYTNYVCFYQNDQYNHRASGLIQLRELADFYNCGRVNPGDGWVTSVYNNTGYTFQLWSESHNPDYLVATIAPHSGIGYLGSSGNDQVDLAISPGCK